MGTEEMGTAASTSERIAPTRSRFSDQTTNTSTNTGNGAYPVYNSSNLPPGENPNHSQPPFYSSPPSGLVDSKPTNTQCHLPLSNPTTFTPRTIPQVPQPMYHLGVNESGPNQSHPSENKLVNGLNLNLPSLHYSNGVAPTNHMTSHIPYHNPNGKINSPILPKSTEPHKPQERKQKEGTEDGNHKWRKYGSKKTKGISRAYFRCRNQSCAMKMITETSVKNGVTCTNTVYKGEHNHGPPQITYVDVHSHTNFKQLATTKTIATEANSNSEDSGFAPKLVCTLHSEIDPLDDGFHWRKYGQKLVKGSPHPRSYFKCTYTGCSVKKQLERDGENHICSYEGLHTHAPPDTEPRDQPISTQTVVNSLNDILDVSKLTHSFSNQSTVNGLGQKRTRVDEWDPLAKKPPSTAPMNELAGQVNPSQYTEGPNGSPNNVNISYTRKFPSLIPQNCTSHSLTSGPE